MKTVALAVLLTPSIVLAGDWIVVREREPVMTFGVHGDDLVNDGGSVVGTRTANGWTITVDGSPQFMPSALLAPRSGAFGDQLEAMTVAEWARLQDERAARWVVGVLIGLVLWQVYWRSVEKQSEQL